MKGIIGGCILALAYLALCCAAVPAAAPVQPPVAVVSFDFYHHEVLIQATVNGQGPFPMLLDTGTNPSVIDLSLARQLGLALTPAGSGSGGGTEKNLTEATTLPTIGIGGLSVRNIPALAMDLSALSRRYGRPIRGVLGDSLMTGRVVQFDYPARLVRFLPPSPPPPGDARQGTAAHTVLPFHHEDCVQINAVTVNGRPIRANIDTGSNSAFTLTPRAVLALGLTAQARRARPAHGAGFNGAFRSRVGTVSRITIGAIPVLRPTVTFWTPGTGHDDTAWGLNIGNVFLQHYVVTFDYVHKRITLDRPPSVENNNETLSP